MDLQSRIFIGTQTGLTYVVNSKRKLAHIFKDIACLNVSSAGISNRTSEMSITNAPTFPSKQAMMSSPITKTVFQRKNFGTSEQAYVSSSDNKQEPIDLRTQSSQNAAPSCSTINISVSTTSVRSDAFKSNLKQNVPGLKAFTLVRPRLTKDIFMVFGATTKKDLRSLFETLKKNSVVEALMVTIVRTNNMVQSHHIHVYLVMKKKMKHPEIQRYVEGLTDLRCVVVMKVVNAKTLISFMNRTGSLKFNIKTPRRVNDQEKNQTRPGLVSNIRKLVSPGPSLSPTPPDEIALLPTCGTDSQPVSRHTNKPSKEVNVLELGLRIKQMSAKREEAQNVVVRLKRQVHLQTKELIKKKVCLQFATQDLEQVKKDCALLQTAADLQQELQKHQQHIEQQQRIEGRIKKKLQLIGSALSTQDTKK